ncbi:hypothetical protein BC829DRAFT_207461 [Chytridium lagenaria]|nr:hypothetical protein BC829DRAFT_207461 [Chytridium lagenaria]
MLRDILKPFSVCAPTVLRHAAIITSISAVVLLILRYLFLWICLSPETGLPFIDDTRVFGLLTVIGSRGVSVIPLASQTLFISPQVDYTMVFLPGLSLYAFSWIFQPQWNFWVFVKTSALPILFTTTTVLCGFMYPMKGKSVVVGLLMHCVNALAYIVVLICFICGCVVCLHLSNQRIHLHISQVKDTGSDEIERNALGFLSPQYSVPAVPTWRCVYSKKDCGGLEKPETYDTGARNSHPRVKAGFRGGSECDMGDVGDLVLFRSQGYRFYYIGTIGLHVAHVIERILGCYVLMRRLRKQVVPMGLDETWGSRDGMKGLG